MQANNDCVRTDRFLRLPEVERICGLRKTTIYKLVNDCLFPREFGSEGLVCGAGQSFKSG
jgi:predicted DNA-binding transcriptional regulator AlpA